MVFKKIIGLTFVFVCLLFLIGCSLNPSLKIKLQTEENFNPDKDNQGYSAEVVLYQLSESDVFEEASFYELWQEEEKTLGKTLCRKKKILLQPHSSHMIRWPREEKSEYLGVVVLMHSPENKQWKYIKKLPLRGVVRTLKFKL